MEVREELPGRTLAARAVVHTGRRQAVMRFDLYMDMVDEGGAEALCVVAQEAVLSTRRE